MPALEVHLRERLGDISESLSQAKADGTIDIGEAWALFGQITAAGSHVMGDLGSSSGIDHLTRECEALFDEHIKPIDIKGVPNWIEPTVDRVIRSQIRPMLVLAAEKLAEVT
jgi:hypothetical protein